MDLKEVIKKIDSEKVINILADLVSIPGHKECTGQEEAISRHVADVFKQAGVEARTQEVETNRKNVIAKIPGKARGRSLALNGHLDTVPPSRKMKDYKPRIEGENLYGLGSADMKGGVAAMVYSLLLIKKYGIKLDGDLYFTGVIGEETGGGGTHHLINETGFRADYFIVGEPTGLSIINSHKGVHYMEVTIEGRAAHGSMPGRGVNAIDAMAEFIHALNKDYVPILKKKHQKKVGSPTISSGIIKGGNKINVVADTCKLKLDRRWIKSEKVSDLSLELEPYLDKVCSSNKGYSYNIRDLMQKGRYHGPFHLPQEHDFVKLCTNVFHKIGIKAQIKGMQGWTDGATILNRGYPTLIIGPGSMNNAHSPGEFIRIPEMIEAVKVYLGLIFEICKKHP